MDDSSRWILDDLPVGVWVAEAPSGRAVYANQAFREILGMDAVTSSIIEDAPATYGIYDRAGRLYPVEALPFCQALATGQRVVVDDLSVHRADGTEVAVRAVGQPMRDAAGRITHVTVAFTDISREAKALAERESAQAKLKMVVDHAPIAFFTIDKEGIIIHSEGAGLKPLGFEAGELEGRSVFELYHDHPTIPGYLRRGLSGESFWYSVAVGDLTFDTWITPLRDARGELSGAIGVSNDVSELRRLQARSIQNDRVAAMGMLAASVAHEINNPLTYMLLYLDELEHGLRRHVAMLQSSGADPKLHEAAASLEDALVPVRAGVERIATITRDLRTFSRPDDTKLELLHVRNVIESVLKLVRKEIEARARLELSLGDTERVLGNEVRLVQVVLNLLMNALQALSETSTSSDAIISVKTQSREGSVSIEVGDSGPGVPIRDRERIFEPFVTTKAVGVGTGLGLFVCRNIVRGMGGEIAITDRPGGGALFRLTLPAARPADIAAVSSSVRPPSSATPGARGRVLVIDDDVGVTRALAVRLRSAGFEVQTMPGAEPAVPILVSGERFDLVYCDLMMKGMTGMDLAERLASEKPAALDNVVFMTGGAFTPRAAAFAESCAGRCVEKPFDVVADAQRRLRR